MISPTAADWPTARASAPPARAREHDERELQQREEQQRFGGVGTWKSLRSSAIQIIPPLIEITWPVM